MKRSKVKKNISHIIQNEMLRSMLTWTLITWCDVDHNYWAANKTKEKYLCTWVNISVEAIWFSQGLYPYVYDLGDF